MAGLLLLAATLVLNSLCVPGRLLLLAVPIRCSTLIAILSMVPPSAHCVVWLHPVNHQESKHCLVEQDNHNLDATFQKKDCGVDDSKFEKCIGVGLRSSIPSYTW